LKRHGRRIAVLAREPVPGRVKTRLEPVLCPEGCARLHRALTLHTLETCCRLDDDSVDLWCAPDPDHAFFRDCAARFGVPLIPQPDGNLGRRMYTALLESLSRAGRVVIVGTDCPDLDVEYLGRAFDLLSKDVPVVLGPALDGGYVLIGCSAAHPDLFTGIDWGEDRVMEQTRAALRCLGWDWEELQPLPDIDRPEDLALLPPFLRDAALGEGAQ
jgi:rSAM/selenodomain-associated transferase 1